MTQGDWTYGADNEKARAIERVESASVEQSRLRDEHEGAKGSSAALETAVLLREANNQVTARRQWLHWVEEQDY